MKLKLYPYQAEFKRDPSPLKVLRWPRKAGMRKITTQIPAKQALALAEILESVGLDRRMFGSVGHVEQRLRAMSKKSLGLVHAGFIRHKHGRFLKEFFSDVPFGHVADYEKCVKKASVEQLARLIKACGFLLQQKAYLFWAQSCGRIIRQKA